MERLARRLEHAVLAACGMSNALPCRAETAKYRSAATTS
jgi:hypothetical protein